MPGDDTDSTGEVTRLLAEWRGGNPGAFDRLVPIVYDELRRLARRQLRRLRSSNDTLNTTALVHEAYLKLVGHQQGIGDRNHFLAVAATAMRHILVDYARRQRAAKRGGDAQPWALEEADAAIGERQVDLVAVDEALGKLSSLDARLVQLVELRVFAGMSVEECAGALQLSERTMKRDWQKARAFLARELADPAGG